MNSLSKLNTAVLTALILLAAAWWGRSALSDSDTLGEVEIHRLPGARDTGKPAKASLQSSGRSSCQ